MDGCSFDHKTGNLLDACLFFQISLIFILMKLMRFLFSLVAAKLSSRFGDHSIDIV